MPRKIGDKILYTREEVLKNTKHNVDRFVFKAGYVFRFYMSYDNDPDTFEIRWGIVLRKKEPRVLLLEGSSKKHYDFPQIKINKTSENGLKGTTYVRTDQILEVDPHYFVEYKGKISRELKNKILNDPQVAKAISRII